MTHANYRDALRLVNTALALIRKRPVQSPQLRRRLRALSLEVDLLRARLGQVPASSRRN